MLQDHYFSSETSNTIIESLDDDKGISQVDLGYIALFSSEGLKDYDKLQKYYDLIRDARERNDLEFKNELIQYYEQFLARNYQDKTVCYELLPEPLMISYKADRVVFAGLERIADLATGKSSITFNFYAIGTGTSPVLPSDQFLDFEEHRVSISTTGFAESKGSSMVFAATFPRNLPSMVVTESGIFDRFGSPSTMLLRTLYEGSNAVSHVFNQTFVATSHFIYQLSL